MPRSSLSVYVSDGEAPKRRILSVADDGYDTGPLFLQAADAIRNARGEFELDLGIDAPDADEESLPGTGFPKEFIACAADVTLRVNVVVRAVSTSDNEQPHCGAYFYIDSDEELDIRQIGSVAGTQPTRVAKKGEQGEYAVYKCNSWVSRATYIKSGASPSAEYFFFNGHFAVLSDHFEISFKNLVSFICSLVRYSPL